MKSKIIFVSAFLLTATTLFSQQNKPLTTKPTSSNNQCDDLKKENENLKKSLKLSEPLKEITENDIELKIIKVKGNIKTQMITIDVLMTNKIHNRKITINHFSPGKIVLIEGDVLKVSNQNIAGQKYVNEAILNTEVPIKSTFEFGPLLPSNEYIKLLNIEYSISDNRSNSINTSPEFRDLKIEWK